MAHVKHLAHVCHAGRVEAQWLVERRRALPSHDGAHRGGRYPGREAPGRGGRGGCTQRARRVRPDTGGHGTREGRTRNMPLIFVTLDVSRLSGWLNADAPCRVTTGAHRGRYPGIEAGGGGAGARSVCTEDPAWTLGGTAREGAHHEHVVHVWDAGRVEAQRLVERRRVLPSHAEAHGG